MEKKLIIIGQKLQKALMEAGIADPDTTHRIIIDIPCGDVVKVYVEHFGDERLIDILGILAEGLPVEEAEQS